MLLQDPKSASWIDETFWGPLTEKIWAFAIICWFFLFFRENTMTEDKDSLLKNWSCEIFGSNLPISRGTFTEKRGAPHRTQKKTPRSSEVEEQARGKFGIFSCYLVFFFCVCSQSSDPDVRVVFFCLFVLNFLCKKKHQKLWKEASEKKNTSRFAARPFVSLRRSFCGLQQPAPGISIRHQDVSWWNQHR